MFKVSFRQKAIEDLNNIWTYTYENWSKNQADKYYVKIKFACTEIAQNPKLGKVYNGITEGLFGLKSGKHVIFYSFISNNEIEIIRILHERMDLKNRLTE